MTTKTEAAHEVRKVLQSVKDYLAEPGFKLSEADTRAHFIDPLLRALGYHAIGDIQHEVFVPDAKQRLDYQIRVDGVPRVAVEAKGVEVPIADAHGAQVVAYCAVLGVEWAVVTNVRDWRLYHAFTNGPLANKLMLSTSLTDWDSDQQYDALFEKVWLISKEAFQSGGGPSAWLAAQQLDVALKPALSDPASPEVKYLRKRLFDAGIVVSVEEVAAWLAAKVSGASVAPPSVPPTKPLVVPPTPPAPVVEPPVPHVAAVASDGKQPGYWIVPAMPDKGLSAAQQLKMWLDAGFWGFWEATPGRKSVKAGDWVVFYASKAGVLTAYARVTADPTELLTEEEWPEPGVPSQPTYKVPLADVKWIDPPRKLDEALRAQLEWYQGKSHTHTQVGIPCVDEPTHLAERLREVDRAGLTIATPGRSAGTALSLGSVRSPCRWGRRRATVQAPRSYPAGRLPFCGPQCTPSLPGCCPSEHGNRPRRGLFVRERWRRRSDSNR